AVARSEADWYVGLNATRALTMKYDAQLSAGRVQTPTLGIIAARENEIKAFRPQNFYGIQLKTKQGLRLNWQDSKGNQRIFSHEKAEQLLQNIKKENITITSVSTKEKKQFAPQLYDLTELQRDANKIFGLSGKQTLNAMQTLYERHKVLTYPRTDSRVLSSDIVPTLNDRLDACGTGDYRKIAQNLKRKNFQLPKSVVNNAAVSDHHAIIPTEEPADWGSFGSNERKIYDLVIQRFLAVLSEPYIYEETRIQAICSNEYFTAKEINVKQSGWKAIVGDNATEEEIEVHEGQQLSAEASLTKGETSPPERLTEGALIEAMENPAADMDQEDKKLVKTLQQAGGIGTVATRADIIDKLINGQYMDIRGKHIFLTQTGRQLLDLAPEDLRSPALTAEWEQKLTQIERGKLNKNAFINDIKGYTKNIIHEIKNAEATFKHDNLTGSKCPQCGGLMLEIENKHGKMLRCKDRSCNYKKNIYKNTNARCPNCKKKMRMFGEGSGKTFT